MTACVVSLSSQTYAGFAAGAGTKVNPTDFVLFVASASTIPIFSRNLRVFLKKGDKIYGSTNVAGGMTLIFEAA